MFVDFDLKSRSFFRTLSESSLFRIAVAGLVLHFILAMCLTFTPDVGTWGIIMENFRSGAGLYDYEGYYYPPVWGYILATESWFIDTFLDIPVMVTTCTEPFLVEDLNMAPRMPSWWFALYVKIPLIFMDLVASWLTYKLVIRLTGDEKKGVRAFTIFMFFPLSLTISSVGGMFDVFPLIFVLLTIMFVLDRHYAAGGMTLAVAGMIKFFPFFLTIPLLIYIWKKSGNARDGLSSILVFLSVAVVVSFILIVPQVIEGTLWESMQFITNRLSTEGDLSQISSKGMIVAVLFAVGVIVLTVFSVLIYRRSENLEKTLIMMSSLYMGALICISYHPQYFVEVLPFFIICMLVYRIPVGVCMILVSAVYLLKTIMRVPALLMPLAYESDLISIESLSDMSYHMLNNSITQPLFDFIGSKANYLQVVFIAIMLLFIFVNILTNRGEGGKQSE